METDGLENPVVVEAYTVPQAAKALGISELTIKRYIEEDLIPAPILRDTARGYRHYSVGELQLIAMHLNEHERDYSYYSSRNTQTRERIMQAIHAWRRLYI